MIALSIILVFQKSKVWRGSGMPLPVSASCFWAFTT